MLNQAYTSKNLLRHLRKNEPKKHRMGRSQEEYIEYINTQLAMLNPVTHNFSSLSQNKINGRKVFVVSDIVETLLLRKCNDNLKRIYSIRSSDRQDIVNKTHIMLSEVIPFYVYKLDIESFYEKVDKHKIISKISDNNIVSYHTKKIMSNLLQSAVFQGELGLPRGVGISSTLSELYLEEFDKTISRHASIYYSSRYVDDVIVFSFEKIPEFLNFFQKMLPEPLELNKGKCQEYVIDNNNNKQHTLDFLGYRYTFGNKVLNKKRSVEIKLSQSKVDKLKKRIALALRDYSNTGKKETLINRIKYLTGNFPIETPGSDEPVLYSGIYYTFMHLTDYTQLEELDKFKNFLVYAPRGPLARNLKKWTPSEYQVIKKYSFYLGHVKKIKIKFTSAELKEITRVW